MSWLQMQAVRLVWDGPKMPTWLCMILMDFAVGGRGKRVKR